MKNVKVILFRKKIQTIKKYTDLYKLYQVLVNTKQTKKTGTSTD